MKEKKKIFRGIGIQIDRTRKTLVRRERLVVCIGCIKWTEKNKKKKTAMMPSTSTISVYVSTFLITESRRASGSGTRRQPSLTRPGLRLNPPFTPFFALFPLPRLCVCVCSCACLYVCVPLSLILPSLRLLYSTPRRLNRSTFPPPLSGSSFPRTKTETNVPSTVPLGNTEIAIFFPLKDRTIRNFLLLLLFCPKVYIYISFIGETVVAKKGRLELAGR